MGVKWKVVGLLCCVCVSVCGAPAEDVHRKSVLELLEDLKVACSENPFLNNSMSDNPMFAHCEKVPAELKKSDLYCLSFLDVNRRLCALGDIAAFNWSERVRNAQSKELTAALVCDPDTGIMFSNLEEYPTYKETIDKVFHDKIACLSLCIHQSEEVIDVGVNNFCKVLYYATAIIESVKKDSSIASTTQVTPQKLVQPPIQNVISASEINKNIEETMKSGQPVTKGNTLSEEPKSEIRTEVSAIVSPQIISINNKQQHKTTTNQAIQQQQNEAALKPQKDQDSIHDLTGNMKQGQQLSKPAEYSKQVETNEMKPPTLDQESSKTLHEQELKNKLTSTVLNKKLVQDQNEDQNPDDLPTLDDDNYDSDDDARVIDQGSAGVVSPQLEEEDIPKKKIGTPRQEQISVDKELAAAYIPPEYDENDDGSFVPLFFFGVFSMVLLYILYHNKNKIMGLMIEGRQGRRRNSRGHAYRRLDTLEQAMSSNPTTTPSKIIY